MALLGKGRQLVTNLKDGFLPTIDSLGLFNTLNNPDSSGSPEDRNEGRIFYSIVTGFYGFYFHNGTGLVKVESGSAKLVAPTNPSDFTPILFAVNDNLNQVVAKINGFARKLVPASPPVLNSSTPVIINGFSFFPSVFFVPPSGFVSQNTIANHSVILINGTTISQLTLSLGYGNTDGFLLNGGDVLHFYYYPPTKTLGSLPPPTQSPADPFPIISISRNLISSGNPSVTNPTNLVITREVDPHSPIGRYNNSALKGAEGFWLEAFADGIISNININSGLDTSQPQNRHRFIFSINNTNNSRITDFDLSSFNSNPPFIDFLSSPYRFYSYNVNNPISLSQPTAYSNEITNINDLSEKVSGVSLLRQNIIIRFFINSINNVFSTQGNQARYFRPNSLIINSLSILPPNAPHISKLEDIGLNSTDVIFTPFNEFKFNYIQNSHFFSVRITTPVRSTDNPSFNFVTNSFASNGNNNLVLNGILSDYAAIARKIRESNPAWIFDSNSNSFDAYRLLSTSTIVSPDLETVGSNYNYTPPNPLTHDALMNTNYELQIKSLDINDSKSRYVLPQGGIRDFSYNSQSSSTNYNISALDGVRCIEEEAGGRFPTNSEFRFLTVRIIPKNNPYYFSIGKTEFNLFVNGYNLHFDKLLVHIKIDNVTFSDGIGNLVKFYSLSRLSSSFSIPNVKDGSIRFIPLLRQNTVNNPNRIGYNFIIYRNSNGDAASITSSNSDLNSPSVSSMIVRVGIPINPTFSNVGIDSITLS